MKVAWRRLRDEPPRSDVALSYTPVWILRANVWSKPRPGWATAGFSVSTPCLGETQVDGGLGAILPDYDTDEFPVWWAPMELPDPPEVEP